MFILGVVSATILCLGLAKIFGFYPNKIEDLEESCSNDSRPGTPISTSEEEDYEDEVDTFEEELSTSDKDSTDLRTIIENYKPG